ncbi:trehalose-6-phosphate hydrolase [Lactobacillus delbrueckii subsp. lactis]|jgi:trehalose-6-phosphate hydrolase|uniref:alpha,alpha-phosphotrehalase n=1 Tax=Lactobacillus delbrueckii TaxID=1584 RepID=UPI00090BCF16|nr:alpha,alpha-phosphotrehalase [Lactobacillus delbrueckii]APG70455.1 alpha,alpha-phosphotrehalase [Lactobacillus delbrueckii subsp. lactis]ASW64565.1 alpha,alpha-phosphotrehalase [Lactobacillus delbrueckii subsp. lactis]MCD5444764.1 alpha,alpha-phosphotrehalase [Lactobacillus delbrueckii subsp. lactis]MCD5509131.1 alpha,alpha-phosphotrehalase [Lactobacillus delbrueckii subsp. lactis]MCD5512827.1 alpha,alpha-phosphotrehalase [Lactobacillus delbrueckii subsp. lactis]
MQNLGQKVIYQIYPKSFYDANGDGIGDLRGIIEKIDYIKKLNVDMIWFNPFYVSPQNDNGYDIANYREIDPLFGTMADFEELQAKLADIGVGVMLDMVLNHCSTEHEWFKKALAGDEKYRKFFYLRPGKPDGSLPNNWQSKFGGPAWSKFGDTDLYYLHLYDSTQADLDWHNPEVRKELEDVVNFWRGKGVRGFRFDVINVTGKSEDLVDSTDPTEEKTLYTDTPVVHDYLKELNRTTFGQDEDSITVGEMSSTTIPNSVRYTNPKEKELSMVFTFHHLKVDYKDGEKWTKTPFDFMKLKGLLSSWQTGMTEGGGWNAVFWNNHDQPWALNRFGDPVHYREKSAEMLAATIHFLRGTPFIYQGEELGMVNPDYQSMDEYVDVECKNAYQELLDKGMSEDEAFAIIKAKSRDNSRVPMHWDDSKYAGFSQVKPWLLPTHQDEINVKKELAEGEIFAFYQKLIALRKQEAVISAGGFREILPDDQQVFAYVRELDGEKLVVFNNFYGKEAVISVPSDLQECGQILLDNYKRELSCLPGELSLRPYESLAFRI